MFLQIKLLKESRHLYINFLEKGKNCLIFFSHIKTESFPKNRLLPMIIEL